MSHTSQRSLLHRLRAVATMLVLVFAPFTSSVLADDTTTTVVGPTTPPGPTSPVGPIGTVGPTGQVGPTSNPGPTEPVGPQPTAASTEESVEPNDPINSNTGANSTNANNESTTNSTDTNVNNSATTTNNVGASLSTGNNSLTDNSKVGGFSSGTIAGNVNVLNVSNSVFAPGSTAGVQTLNGGTGDITLSTPTNQIALPTSRNSNTGTNSSNTNTSDGTTALQVVDNNDATANNDIAVAADTGHNNLDSNTAVGDVSTGDVDLGVTLMNLLNLFLPDVTFHVNVWSIYGDLIGNVALPGQSNSHTGSNSNNANSANETNSKAITVNQSADAVNGLDVNATTGGNAYNDNSETGNIQTGDTNINGSAVTIANTASPDFYLFNVFGNWANPGDLPSDVAVNTFGNANTGSNSNNTNSGTTNNSSDVTLNNTAHANNHIAINANTGNNTFSKNTKLGNISTGDINIVANVINFLNSFGGNVKDFTFGIVNVFGNWKGTVGPAHPQVAAATTPNTVTTAGTSSTAGSTSNTSANTTSNGSVDGNGNVTPTTNSTAQSNTSTNIYHAGGSTTSSSTGDSSAVAQLANAIQSPSILATTAPVSGSQPAVQLGSNNMPITILGMIFLAILIAWGGMELLSARTKAN